MNIREFEFEDMGRCEAMYADVYGQSCIVDMQVTARVDEVTHSNGVGHEWTEYEIKVESCHAFFIDNHGGEVGENDEFDEYTKDELEALVLKELLGA